MSFMQQAVREWAYQVGVNRQTQLWLLSDYDSWELNPHYVGPDQGHPEYDEPTCSVYLSFNEAAAEAKRLAAFRGTSVFVNNDKVRCWVVRC